MRGVKTINKKMAEKKDCKKGMEGINNVQFSRIIN